MYIEYVFVEKVLLKMHNFFKLLPFMRQGQAEGNIFDHLILLSYH